MKRKSEKVISTVMSSLMALSLVSVAPTSVQAKTKVDSQKEELMKKVKEAYEKRFMGVDKVKGKRNFENDNLPTKRKENPEERIRIIVEVNDKALVDYVPKGQTLAEASKNSTLMKRIQNSKLTLKQQIKRVNSTIKIRHDYSILINGFSAEVQYKDIEKIKELPGVKHVTVAKKYYPDMNYAKSLTGAEEVWKDYGHKGEGSVVSIIDTGIDWKHKDMRLSDTKDIKITKDSTKSGKGKWYSDKVPYGYNFADCNAEVVDKTSSMHGMHVAGIVGANCKSEDEIKGNRGIKGVAPEAQLLAMKVFSNNPEDGGAFSDDIVAAIDDSAEQGADVINMSLGSTASFQDPEDAEQKVIQRATEKGTVVVVSAGNSQYALAPYRAPGANDTGLVGSPGLAEDSLQVASFENNIAVLAGMDFVSGGESGLIPYTSAEMGPLGILNNEEGYELVECGAGKTEEFTGKDLKGKIALIKRGEINLTTKKLNAQEAGAVGVIVYNKDGDNAYINMASDSDEKIPSIFISNSHGEKLKVCIKKGLKVKFNDKIAEAENAGKNDMSDFTSWGPTPNLDFKPELTAPGGQIWSTVNNNKYENMSGTSMASPHMAGSMALIMQHINKLKADKNISLLEGRERAEFAKKLAVNTAKVMMENRDVILEKDKDGKVMRKEHVNTPFSPRRQGAGMVNTLAAVKNNVTVEFKDNKKPVVALKEIGSEKTFTLKLHNYGKDTVTYNVKPVNDKVLTETNNELNGPMSYDVEVEGSKVSSLSDTIKVEPGKDAEVGILITMPNDAPKDIFAEGFIRFVPENKAPEIGIPFMGFYGEWDRMPAIDAPLWDKEKTFFEQTTLLSINSKGKPFLLGQVGGNNEYPVIEEDKIAFSNAKMALNQCVLPFLYPLRNIKTMNVQVVNKNDEVLRTLSTENNIRKIVVSDPEERGYRADGNWIWDGHLFNKDNGKYEKAPDGQYKLRTQSCIDYKGAKSQNLDMKVKIDSVAPDVQIAHNTTGKKSDNSYTIKFQANDYGPCPTGIQAFMFALDGQVYADDRGNYLFKEDAMAKDTQGNYTKKLTGLPQGNNNITVIAIDYAGNGGMGDTIVTKKVFNEIGFYKDGNEITDWKQIPCGNFDLKFDINSSFMGAINKVRIMVDGKTQKIMDINPEETSYSYSFKDVTPGEHMLQVKLMNYSEEVETWGYKIVVQNPNLELFFEDLKTGEYTNLTTYVVGGTLTSVPDEFTINDEKVEVRALSFSHPVKLESNKMNKIRVYGKKGDKEYNHAYNVYCDPDAPELNIDIKGATEKGNEILVRVPADTKKYAVKGNVKDTAFGYTFYISGDAVHKVSSDVPKVDVYNFEKEVELTANTTVVELEAVDECDNKTTKIVKIIKEVKDGELKIEKINMKDSYVSGEQFNGGIKVTNPTEQAKAATLIVGVFNDQNKMVNVALASQVIGAGGTVELSTKLIIPEKGNYTIKCFVWDSLDSMLPLSEVIEIPVVGK